MPNDNVAILSIMSKFDEKSAREAAKRADKVYEEALSDIGNVNFDKKLIENFDKAMNLLKNKFKKVNLSSYTNSLLDSIFSDKDIKEKSKDIESFISKIEMLKKASSGQDINAFNTFSAKQIDALISRTEKLAQKQEEINEKTREYNREATKIAKANRSISTIDKNYGNQDYSKTLESLKKSLGTEKEFTAEQNQSIENLAKMVNLYQIMEKSEPQKGTAEAIRYSKDLLAVTQKIKEERDKIDAFSQKGASTYIANNGLSSIDKVSDYTVNKSKEDFVKASLSNLKSQEAKLQSELTTYISESVQKNLAKVSKEVDAVVDKAEKRVENLQNKIDSLQAKSTKTGSDNSIIGNIVSETDIKSLEEIEDRLFAIQDKYLEVDENGYATNDLSTKELKEFISLYKEYEQLPSDNKFESDLPDTYKSIIESDENLQKYADTLDKTIAKQKELNEVKSDEYGTSVDTQTKQLVKQEEQIKETIQAEKQLQDIQEKVSSNTKISVDAEQAIADINKIKENLDSIPNEKNIKINVSSNDYSNTPLLSNELGEVVTAFRGVKDAWSGLVNDKGIGFFTDKLKLAVDYADELSKDGKVYQANLSFHNPLEVDGKGARWDQIDFNGIKQKTDDIIQLAKQLGHDGVIFKNIRDGFTDTDEDISNVMVALNAAQIKNEQVIGTVKAGTGEMADVASKIDNATNIATNSTVESQNKIQEELKETQKQAEQTSEALSNIADGNKSNILSAINDVFQGETEKSGMDAIASATEEAVQSKKDFATANEGVQSSIDGSKSPLQLEAELMDQIAKFVREAADAKKEFVEANKQVKDSVADTNEEKKRENTEENTNAWKELTYSIQRYSEVSKRISSGKALEGDIEEASRLENKISQLQKLDILSPTQIEKSEQMLTKLYDSLDDIEKKSKEATLESLNSSIDKYRNDYNSRSSKPFVDNQSDEYKKLLANYETSIKELESYRDKISNNPLVSKEDLNQIDELTKKVKESATAFNSLTASQKGSTPLSRGKTIEWANDLLEQNSKWSKKAKIEVQGWINKLATADPSNVEEIRNRILEVVRAEREAGNAGKTWLDIFSTKKLHNFLGQAASMFSFYDLISLGREGFQTIREIDTALVDLKKTTAMNSSQLEEFYFDSNDVAKQMGVTTQAIIEQASAWSRLGYSTKESSTQMAELSSQFAAISPDMDLDTATDGLVSSMKAFDIEVSNVERDIMDNINRIGNTAATSNGEIVDMLTRSSAAMAAANNTIQETIALETAAVEITRNAETTGTAFKTLSMRIRGYDEETEELSDDLKNISGDIADLTKTASTPGGISLFTDETKETYKSTYQILKEISDIYDELSDKNRAELLEKLAGKRGGQVVAGLLSNFDAAEKALREMEGAAGSADAEMSIVEESIDFKLNKLQQTWVGTIQNIVDRGDLGTAIDGLTKLSEAIGWVIDKFGVLGTTAIVGGGILGGKNLGKTYEYTVFKLNCFEYALYA